MRIFRLGFLLFVFCLLSGSRAFATIENMIQNASFESDLGGASNWDNTANRGLTTPAVGNAPDGARVLRISENQLAAGQFGFTFQGSFPAKAGDRVSIAGFAREAFDDGGGEIPQLVIEFQGSYGTIQNAVGTASGTFVRITRTDVAPAGTARVVFVVRLQNATTGGGNSVGEFDAIEATVNDRPVLLQAAPSSDVARPGQLNALTMKLENKIATTLTNVQVVTQPGNGIRVLPEQGSVDAQRITSESGSVIFHAGNLDPGQNSVFSVPFILTSGILPGKSYEIVVFAQNATFGTLSATQRILIRGELDPVFGEGTIIGKVFHDINKNGIQDSGEHGEEYGIPGVTLVTEEGVVVVTDKDGKYHIPAVKPGRHVVKIDGHTLPEGTEFVTEEAFLVKTTPGILNKANFAVALPPNKIPRKFSEELTVLVTQGLDATKAVLDVKAEPEVLRLGVGTFQKEPVFQFQINYPDFVKNWYLEIRDDLGQEVWTGFGVGAPPSEVIWSGQDEYGVLIKPGLYSYQLKVEDKDNNQDWTVLRFLRVLSQSDTKAYENALIEIPPVGDFNLFADGKRNIPLVAKPTLHVQGYTKKGNTVLINSYPVEVDPETGRFDTSIYTSPGQKGIKVISTDENGESVSYKEEIQVKDSSFFMVGLAEEQLGINFQDGDVETVAADDQFKRGFYEDGRLSFYLKGKLKGKFLIKAHYDTDDKRSALITNLDPDDYYPVYGDSSERDYEAHDTLDRFFFVIEMDRSFAKWGSYRTNFNDTETATYNRTLNGLKVHYETVRNTPYGDPKSEITGFVSEARHRADHNEFMATGGALYYLRNRNVIEGSEQVRVEIRDKIQGIAIHSYDLLEGADYQIDYGEGRIFLTKALSSVAATDTLVSSDILDGSPVYLIVDFEYDAGSNAFVNGNRGVRGSTHMGDHLKIGGTFVTERRRTTDYEMRGLDLTVKLGRNTKIVAEYTETSKEQADQAVSFNGGLSFANLEPLNGLNTRDRENAYLIKAESKPVKNLEVSGFLQNVEPGFSSDKLRSQEGFKKYGLAALYRIGKYATIRYRFDHSEVADQLLPLRDHGVFSPFENFRAHTAQAAYDDGRYLVNAEYRYQNSLLPSENLSPTLTSEIPFRNGLAMKLGYRLNERLLPYARIQVSTNGAENNQWGGGLRYEVTNTLTAYIEHLFGNIGDSTVFGFERSHDGSSRSYANLRMVDRGIGSKVLTTAIGNSFALGSRSRIFTEREFSNVTGPEGYADIVGYEGMLTDKWKVGARFERRHLDNSSTRLLDDQAIASVLKTNTHHTLSGTIAYDDGKRVKFRSYLEGRRDSDAPTLWQIVTRNIMEYQVNEDLQVLGKVDFGKSRFTDPEDTAADFLEMSTGFAYRPIHHDELNILGRYSYLRNKGSDLQFASALFGGVEVDERSHLIAVDLAYDLHRYLTVVEKMAYKNSILGTSVSGNVILHNILWAHRFNIHVTRKWDVALEYRMLWQHDALETFKHGALVEVDREFYDYARIGLGYNFTDFNDDLSKASNIDSHGPFVRMTGKF